MATENDLRGKTPKHKSRNTKATSTVQPKGGDDTIFAIARAQLSANLPSAKCLVEQPQSPQFQWRVPLVRTSKLSGKRGSQWKEATCAQHQ
jgi:hypothetical protein